jgi:elongation factor P
MAKKMSEFSKGQGLHWRDDIWIVHDMEHIKPGKGPAYLQTEMKNPKTGQTINHRFRPEETVEPVFFDRKKTRFLYSDGKNHVVMDDETYDQLEIPQEMIGDKSVYLIEDCEIGVCLVDGKIISIELPNSVNLTIEDTPPQLKGATATNQLKDAVCEGGARVKVPPFIENGCVIEVDTRTGEYLGRA